MIVIAAAGNSKRFKDGGIDTPKIMLPIGEQTVFERVLDSFSAYFQTQDFLVATKNNRTFMDFATACLHRKRIKSFEVVGLDQSTGMMPGVAAALAKSSLDLNQPLLISVADIFRPGFEMPQPNSPVLTIDFAARANGKANSSNAAIAGITCGGLGCYHLTSARDFLRIYQASELPSIRRVFGEAAMEVGETVGIIARLWKSGYSFRPRFIERSGFIHCGTPAQYRHLVNEYLAPAHA